MLYDLRHDATRNSRDYVSLPRTVKFNLSRPRPLRFSILFFFSFRTTRMGERRVCARIKRCKSVKSYERHLSRLCQPDIDPAPIVKNGVEIVNSTATVKQTDPVVLRCQISAVTLLIAARALFFSRDFESTFSIGH